jgi:riboflavin kinase/FMN adenylyltransferase
LHHLKELARVRQVPAVAVTFDPPPVALLRPEQAPVPLTTTPRKAELLQEHGADEVVVYHTRLDLLRLSARAFFDQVIRRGFRACAMVEGPNFGFGRDRAGSIDTLRTLCAPHGIQLDVVGPVETATGMVSSSRIRDCVMAGRVREAAELLGRPHRIGGRVGSGAGRGTGLGFPTANVEDCPMLVPADGVYAGRARLASRHWPAALNIGPNPTFGDGARKLEVHLLDYDGSLRGEWLDVDLIDRLRDTRRFTSPDELIEQVQRDFQQVRQLVSC